MADQLSMNHLGTHKKYHEKSAPHLDTSQKENSDFDDSPEIKEWKKQTKRCPDNYSFEVGV